MTTNACPVEIEAEASDFTPLTAEEARLLREKNPELSPWWVVAGQFGAGLLVALVAWWWTERPVVGLSSLYGSLAVAVPAAMFVRGAMKRSSLGNESAAMLRFFVWELVKLGSTIAFLAAAPWVIGDLHWLALLAGVLAAMKMYWVALLVRPGLLNRKTILKRR
ncbi:MAG: ATP synthase subunit I [Comamonadaceae bacterium]|nr:MAG: ATP synthase subunit I [Comamonadaceae bacterium]